MIEDMYRVMNRINELKKRFGLMRHNQPTNANPVKNSDPGVNKPGSFEQIHEQHVKNQRVSSANGPEKNEPESMKKQGNNPSESLVNDLLKNYTGENNGVLSSIGGSEKITSPLENVGKPGNKLKYVNDIIQSYLKNIE